MLDAEAYIIIAATNCGFREVFMKLVIHLQEN